MDYRQKNTIQKADGAHPDPSKIWPGVILAQAELSNYLADSSGCFAHLYRDLSSPSGRIRQKCYPVEKMPEVLQLLDPNTDNWISQAIFWSCFRRVVNVKNISLIFADIDFYKEGFYWAGWAQGKSLDQISSAFLAFCELEGIPSPSLIVFSGRGIQVKWFFDKPLTRRALPRWEALEKEVLARLAPYGADLIARDAARVLRLVETTNTKVEKKCEVIHVEERDGKPITYDFEYLCDCILPVDRQELRDRKREKSLIIVPSKKISVPNPNFSTKVLNWLILEDLRKLVALRGGVIPEGQRELFVFWMMDYMALSGQITSSNFYNEASFVAKEVNPCFKYHNDIFGTLYRKFMASLNGEWVELNGKKHSPLYTPKMTTLIDRLSITEEEQRQLKVIHGQEVKREFNKENNRKWRSSHGAMSRSDYELRAEDRGRQARELKAQGKNNSEIAREMGLSRTQILRYLNP